MPPGVSGILAGAVLALLAPAAVAQADSYSVALVGPATVAQGSPAHPGSATFRITRTGALGTGSVGFATEDQTATGTGATALAPFDYVRETGRAQFSAGADHVDVTVPLIGDDAHEPDASFGLVIDQPQGAPDDQIAGSSATVTLRSSAAPACSAAPRSGASSESFLVEGLARTIYIHVPPKVSAGRRLPVVLALHGFRGDGPGMERFSGLSAVADRYGFVVAYPTAPGGRWQFYAGEPRADLDIEYLRAALERVDSLLCIDPGRRFGTGVSNGGGEVALMACQMGDLLNGVAAVAGDYRSLASCRPSRPVSLMEIHGEADPVVPFAGHRPDGSGSVAQFVAGWRRFDRCGRGSSRRVASFLRSRWSCVAGTRVEQIEVSRFGHGWPGAYPTRGRAPGPGTAAWEVWRFFASLPGRR